MSCSQSRKVTTLPLVLISPLDIATGPLVVVGMAPVKDKNRKKKEGNYVIKIQIIRHVRCKVSWLI